MEFDAKTKRAKYIESAVQIQETFGFANPPEILQAVCAGHWYGSMLWDLNGEMAGQICRSWSTSVKMAWDVPRFTHAWLVDNMLASGFLSVKQHLVGRYVNFVHGLLKSLSPEVNNVANMVTRCARSTTGKNMMNILRETGVTCMEGQAAGQQG